MTLIKMGGVPEYFNHPIQRAIEKSLFKDHDIELQWVNVPEGTGKMAQLLKDGALDLAVILTEGMIRSIALGNTARIIHTFVESPLIWGIHVANDSPIQEIKEVLTPSFAVSRMGSGSHVMATVLAADQGWDFDKLRYNIVDNLEGARISLKQSESDLFLWEKYTTNFLVQSNEFRRIAELPTPWPCFVVASSEMMLNNHQPELRVILEIILQEIKLMTSEENLAKEIASKYKLDIDLVNGFMPNTKWAQSIKLPVESSSVIQDTLEELQLIPKNCPRDFFYSIKNTP